MAERMENRSGNIQNSAPKRGIGRVLLDALAEGVLNFVVFILRFLGWVLGWSLAIAVFVAVMAGAGWYVFNRAVAGGEYVTIPNVVHKPVTKAQFLLAEEGLMIGKQEYYASEEIPEYHIISQRPPAGKVVRKGRKVHLTVSSGKGEMAAPDLVGKPLADARKELKGSRFAEGLEARIPHATPLDTIVAQDPPPRKMVAIGTDINLLVSAGPQERRLFMPDLLGKSMAQVVELLGPLGVQPVPVLRSSGEELDVVLNQDPVAGTLIQEGQTIKYEVAPSGDVSLPGAGPLRRINAFYKVPDSRFPPTVRVDVIESDGTRITAWPARRYEPGTTLTYRGLITGSYGVEFYLEGRKVRAYYYTEGEDAPEVWNAGDAIEGDEGVESEDSPLSFVE